jgi:hypothetical protein
MTTGMAGVYIFCGAIAFGWCALIVAFLKQRPRT